MLAIMSFVLASLANTVSWAELRQKKRRNRLATPFLNTLVRYDLVLLIR
jgi:hypothetical protein